MRKPISKTADTILAFLKAYRRARLNMLIIPLVLSLGANVVMNTALYQSFLNFEQSRALNLVVGLITAWFLLRGLFSFLGGKARCPQCKTMPLVFSKLLGVGPVVRFGIPLFERQIKRCHQCDYPLSLAELEKDLAAERQALEHGEGQPESKAQRCELLLDAAPLYKQRTTWGGTAPAAPPLSMTF